jgi:hypothetical protein
VGTTAVVFEEDQRDGKRSDTVERGKSRFEIDRLEIPRSARASLSLEAGFVWDRLHLAQGRHIALPVVSGSSASSCAIAVPFWDDLE